MTPQELDNQLNPDSTYELTKVLIKNADSRFFQPGDKIRGAAVIVFGTSLVVGDVVTSPIVKISQNGPHYLVETKNSVYTLEKL